jgi:hypothetical protein
MQTAINPALAQVIGAMDVISPVTPEGTPTVAAQVMQAAQQAMTPQVAMPQVAQQAGLAGQIQAMQMQEAQKAMMQAAMQGQPQMQQQMQQMQQQMPQGIERLNPQMGNFAEGGIVGRIPRYAEAGMTEDQMIIEPSDGGGFMVAEPAIGGGATAVAAPVATAPAAPVRPEAGIAGLATSSAPAIAEMRRVAAELAQMPVSADPRKAMEAGLARRQVANEFAAATGNDPRMIENQIKQMEDYYRRRDQQLEQRYQDIEGRKGRESLAEALMGFRQMRGRPFSEGITSSYQALSRFQGGMDRQMKEIEDLRLQMEGLKMERVNTLKTLKYNTDMGYMNEAMKEQQRLIDNDRAQKKTEFELAKKVAELHSQEARTAQVEAGRGERFERRDETTRRGQDIRSRLKLESGSGREPRVQSKIVGENGNVILIMSDGSSRDTGIKSADYNKSIARIVSDLGKRDPEFNDLSVEERRNIAAEILSGKKPSSTSTPVPSPAPGASPVAAPRGTKENPIKLD